MNDTTVKDLFLVVVYVIGVVAGGIGGLYTIISHSSKFKDWMAKRRNRNEALDTLAKNMSELVRVPGRVKSLEIKMDRNTIETLRAVDIAMSNKDTIEMLVEESNTSLKERELLMQASVINLDYLIKNNMNGDTKAVRDEIYKWNLSQAHKRKE